MNKPDITAIILCGTSKEIFDKFLHSIVTTQPIKKVELILVVPQNCDYIKYVNHKFFSTRQFMTDSKKGIDEMRTQAVREALSEIILFLEDHIILEKNLIDSLLELFNQHDYACINWTVLLANNINYITRVNYIIDYSNWGKNRKDGEIDDFLTLHNNSYRKNVLLEFDKDLELFMRSELTLQRKLLLKGHKLYFTTNCFIKHYSIPTLFDSLRAVFWFSWNSADAKQKIESWGYHKRLFYAFAIQIKPILRLVNFLSLPQENPEFSRIKIIKHGIGITLMLFAGSLGEAAAHLFGTYKSNLAQFH
ncbi:hypothetical protein ACFLS9_08670 [Bacteroidota bacterium]